MDRSTSTARPRIPEAGRISLKLFINKETGFIRHAASKKDFVDVLFSFLTLPMGEIVRLCGEQTRIPPLDNLYASVKALDKQLFRTVASMNMLLRPRSAYRYASRLAIGLDQREPSLFYICSHEDCWDQQGFRLVSQVKGSECMCRGAMEKKVCVEAKIADESQGFLKDGGIFIIADDLHVYPANINKLKKIETKRSPDTEVKEIIIGTTEVLRILKYSMLSKRPLTNALLRDKYRLSPTSVIDRNSFRCIPLFEIDFVCRRIDWLRAQRSDPIKKINATMLKGSSLGTIGLQAREDLVDLLFSFLTIPSGSVVKLCRDHADYLGCLNNLYLSVDKLDSNYFNYQESKRNLLCPKIAPKYGCHSQLLNIKEENAPRFDPRARYTYICYKCFLEERPCTHGSSERIKVMDPKTSGQTTGGRGFLKEGQNFLITDDLRVKPKLDKANPRTSQEFTVDLSKREALNILLCSMTSATVLSNALFSTSIKGCYMKPPCSRHVLVASPLWRHPSFRGSS